MANVLATAERIVDNKEDAVIELIQKIIGLGLPVLGTALGGPLGGAVASIIAKNIGAPDPSPETIKATLSTKSEDVQIQQLKSAEAEYVAAVQASAQLGQVQITQIAETIRAEITAAGLLVGLPGKAVQFMALSWRPLFAYETLLECSIMGLITAHELWTGDMTTVNAMMQFQGFLTWYFGMKFSLLGVYSLGRSVEKVNDATQPAPSLVKDVIDKVLASLKLGKK